MKRQNEFLVGISVIIAFAAVVGGAIWLSESDLGNPQEISTVRFREVGGLGVGAPVTVRGVKVGRVNAIRLAANDWVEADLRIGADVILPKRPVAIAASGSLFGEWQVTVVDFDATPLDPALRQQLTESGAPGGGAWPGATLPDIGQLTQQASRIASDIGLVTNRVSGALDSAAVTDVRQSLRALREAADGLAQFARQQTGPFNQLANNLAATSVEVGAASERVNTLLGRVDEATKDGQLATILNSAQSTMGDLRSASNDAKELVAVIRGHEQTLSRIMQTTDTLLTKVQTGQGSLGLLARDSSLYLETTAAIAQMRQLLADIQANPRRYFRFSVF